ncbi:hypothetical protein K435DRAFT_799440 [Dendrothele bispora CBS 962.96]|uniref:Uncharacterized protein n=1 Tax=Dendrothele bispora (strain CBS 962.96) TaxID=1314807 RepID=A0A4S8LVU6_DENBC|nr:hypothetical protein K435DRAFT_799440 [Dendrothele bispora CBS 962.96]
MCRIVLRSALSVAGFAASRPYRKSGSGSYGALCLLQDIFNEVVPTGRDDGPDAEGINKQSQTISDVEVGIWIIQRVCGSRRDDVPDAERKSKGDKASEDLNNGHELADVPSFTDELPNCSPTPGADLNSSPGNINNISGQNMSGATGETGGMLPKFITHIAIALLVFHIEYRELTKLQTPNQGLKFEK